MDPKEVFQAVITIYGTSMAIGPTIQAYKIYKAKSSRNVSRFNFSYVGFGTFLWLIWGILVPDIPLTIANAAGTVGYALCVLAILKYKEES